MNKAITDGLVLMPPPFVDGLGLWSSGDGTPGSDTYAGSGSGVFVSADQDFGGSLEILKAESQQKLRYMGETPILPGCYLRVTARVKAMAGPLPLVQIAGWPAQANSTELTGVTVAGPAVQLDTYGEVVEVSAIIGTGHRGGVDMVWTEAAYGHLGLDLTGPNGGVVRVDDIIIEDVTSVFLRDIIGLVDVRDYGAVGDGVTNDAAAFEAADAAANGREVLVSAGVYYLANSVTFQSQVRFEGTVIVEGDREFILQRNFDFQTYLDAFGNEEQAFRKAFQALLNFSDHESLDLGGRRIGLSAPMDMQAAVPDRTTFATRRVIRNGQFQPIDGPAWNPDEVTSQATYSEAAAEQLTNVVNIANIQVGSLVTGTGVGREVYVREVNVGAQSLTLSQPLYDAEGTQTFTFTRFKYLLDFSGFVDLSQFIISDVDFQCNGQASGIILARQGLTFHLRDCFIIKPRDRGITSPGSGCQGMMIDRCQFLSNEQPELVQNRRTIGFNCNANDVKIRDNRAVMFKHWGVIAGSGILITGNHWFQGDTATDGLRTAGIVFTFPNIKSGITGNYIDNNFIEWTNEHDASPELGNQFSFGGLTITGNFFTANDVGPWFNWLVMKPYGPGHFIHGLAVVGNVFRTLNGSIDRIEAVDTTFADLEFNRMRNITFSGNVFHGVNEEVRNPISLTHTQSTADRVWVVDADLVLPFRGWARTIESVVPVDAISDTGGDPVYDAPWVDPEFGDDRRQFRVIFRNDVTGTVRVSVRMDNPL
ncbi:right-handed parallel beta-helix repeat-containing protein [Ponticoccus sp. SC2-23]|uniref:glycosyl hydrolase family 28-related protein n=1 Tax=Alexandriicola marinus TaxID=2081710 RepID=UPI000FDCAAC2|nr:glycosyl hydrolase family 28-related protein [Alexandriicola marinus]MBM1220014.1 right-handed parallel beta-helix repeat-containing protein [Ponticoccus sp. SC6-9]MBM1224700.1 right-handed parallel beta-helix repeat-containing protein [Ponticoccus sp. SC6-15]MBM1228213.1 right-handed parallel beta-helix repeat-containing protein [Ponticoccus sp. SC6-38]MBM1234149.1 right-handed parallel beta-helix repeat-containing protein [Ponticoccus sp. SC6-45]MBM1238715.1 right-handed parallel beta-hel